MKKILNEVYWFLYFLIRPNWWIRVYPYSKEWDNRLNQVIDNNTKIKNITEYWCQFEDGTNVWISNYPFAYALLPKVKVLPKRITALKFKEYIVKNLNFELLNKNDLG